MSTLEEQAVARKARLLALKQKKRKAEEADAVEPGDLEQSSSIQPKQPLLAHRAFDRETGQSKRHVAGDENTVEKAVEGLAAKIVADDAEKRKQELDLFNIQPKKINWDLKRDVAKKLEKLKSTEQAVIAELIRARIKTINGSNGAAKEAEAAALAAAIGHGDEAGFSDNEDD